MLNVELHTLQLHFYSGFRQTENFHNLFLLKLLKTHPDKNNWYNNLRRCGEAGHIGAKCTEEEKTRTVTDEDGTVRINLLNLN